ncbi:MAG: hypothetical protein ABI641_07535 [Caldimonas sp.]
MSDPDLLQRLKTDLAPRTAQLEKDNEALKPPMQDVINKLSDAIRANDLPLIKRHAKTLEAQVAAYSSLLTRARKVVEDLGKIDTDDRDALKQIVSLTADASTAEGKVMRNYTKLKELLDMAHQKAGDPAVAAAMAQWAEMESWMTTSRDVTRLRIKQMDTLIELAKSAAADGDDKSFAQAQDKAKVRATWKPTQLEVGDKYMKFMAVCEKALGKNLQDELKRDIEKFRRMVTELADMNDKLDAGVATIKAMKMAPPKAASLDYKKAAALLHVDEAKLKKAWAGSAGAPEKALDGLAKDAKLKTSGKEMLAALKKARLAS